MNAVREDRGAAEAEMTETPAAAPRKRGGGPRTPEGRDKARRNALKFGLTADEVFPLDLEAQIRESTAALVREYAPDSPQERWLVGRLAKAQAKLDHCDLILLLDAQRGMDRAELPYWDDDRRRHVEDLGARLPRDPSRVAYALGQTLQGAAWVLGRWEGLGEALRHNGRWDEAQRRLAFDLLGVAAELRDGGGRVPAGDDAAGLTALVAGQVARLTERIEGPLGSSDESYRRAARVGMAFEEDAITKRLRRSEAACKREWATALAELRQFRSEKAQGVEAAAPDAAPAGPGPAPREESPAPTPRPRPTDAALDHLVKRSRQFDLACLAALRRDGAVAAAGAPVAVAASAAETRPVSESVATTTAEPAAAAPVAAPVAAPAPVAAAAPAVLAMPARPPVAAPARGMLARSASLVARAPVPKNRRERLAQEKQARRAAR